MSELAVKHNFIDPEMVAAKGFSVELEIVSITEVDRLRGCN
jgi:hypothetical protein